MEPDESTLEQDIINAGPQSATPPLQMSERHAAPAEGVFDKHRHLVQWVLNHDGYLDPNTQIAFSPRKGYHAVVADGATMANGTRIASCPMPATMSVLNALDIEPFSNHGIEFPKPFLCAQCRKSPECLQAFYLMEQLILGITSWWAPYIATLPTVDDVTAMQFEEEADLTWLNGTNLRAGLSTQTAKWKEMYLQGSSELRQLGWANALNGSYTWPRFRWAASIFGSRSFTSQVLDATLPADLARLKRTPQKYESYDLVKLFSDRFGVLLPLLDLLNHKPGAQVEWQARYNFVGLQILESYESGQELCNNYGPRDNEGLLLAYGFTIENNPFDHLVISIKAPPASPLDVARKTWKQDLRSDPERRCFIFDYKHPESTSAIALELSLFSFDLLDSISILCANEREMQSMNTRRQSLMSFCLHNKSARFEDGRIILAVLSQLLRECSVRAERLRATDPSRTVLGLKPANAKQRNAKIYRDSQLEIVETAVALCKFVLRCAIGGTSGDEQTLVGLQNEVPEAAFGNLKMLVGRHGRLTRPLELLDCNALVEMVPDSDRLWKCLSELEQHLLTAGALPDSKSRLAVALSALYSEYSHGVKLPHRITEWMKQLLAWYPVDPTSWAYVPPPGPWEPGEQPPKELMSLLTARELMSPKMPAESAVKRWLKPERLCWGWNVMEEEKVPVPSSIAEPEIAGSHQDGGSTLIYWQRY
ncbi:hypothetical protein G647_00287 [Cladophialophora carrionii CBS 160.54]|uniref:SET domain-containing protein n=1 Tax=Cladophialophora carrionii CBS 160.54 TaxID=1279043 RepID=V9DNE3_9EURO|nr:uncharacterized protein G647_00287 [Cladophialophora carrionii CBS 160.54]ETI27838.1 hypothetical protein G647_00287 [Cladophialophora carrionii CBS 160.54]